MWPEQQRGWRQRWTGFRDPLGERIVAEAVSGVRSEGLILTRTLAPDDGALSVLSRGIAEVTFFSHPGLRPLRELHRASEPDRSPVLVSDYTAGLRLSTWLSERASPPATGTVLYIAQQLASALRALGEHSPGLFHGAISLDRILIVPDSRVVLVEAGLGQLLASLPERSPDDWWSDYRIATPFSASGPVFGTATDACQLGVVVLELLLGRRLRPADYPNGLALLLGTAEETDLVGDRTPLGAPLFEWLSLALGLDFDRGAPTIAVVAEALEHLLSDDAGYVAVPMAGDFRGESLEPLPFPAFEETVSAPVRLVPPPPVERPVALPGQRIPYVRESRPSEHRSAFEGATSAHALDSRRDRIISFDGGASAVAAMPSARSRGWATMLRRGAMAIVATLVIAGGVAGWRYWRELNIGQGTGTVVVDSKPSGAAILIDGIERGKAPLTLAVVPGAHKITAKSSLGMGSTTIEVKLGDRHDIFVPLTLGSDPGYIDISTEPPGAVVTFDDKPRGTAPLSLDEIPPGEHKLVVEQGAARMERRFTLAPSERLTLYVPLAGWVTVRARVPLRVLDRDKAVGMSNDGRLLVAAGKRRLRFVNDDYGVNTTQDVVVMAGQVAEVNVPLSEGVLSVSSDVDAEVWVDGATVGRTPTGNLSVAIGEHEVLLTHPQWGEQRLTVIVGLGAPTRLSVKLSGGAPNRRGQRPSPKRSGISAAR